MKKPSKEASELPNSESEPPEEAERKPAPRGEAVVESILRAALEELAEVGYGGLRIDDVAARANVNKTTIYRRWPDKGELVKAVFFSPDMLRLVPSTPPDTGNVRDDLLAMCRTIGSIAATTCGRSFIRTFLFDGGREELAPIMRYFKTVRETIGPEIAILRAMARGELPPTTDPSASAEVLASAIHFKTYRPDSTPPDEAYYHWLVDTLLQGLVRPLSSQSSQPLTSAIKTT